MWFGKVSVLMEVYDLVDEIHVYIFLRNKEVSQILHFGETLSRGSAFVEIVRLFEQFFGSVPSK